MKQHSLFDIISPVMIGPSSSHMAGAIRLGLMAGKIYSAPFKKVTFKLYNSFAETGKGHGTDKGLLAGLIGLKADDARVKNVFELDEVKNIEYKYEFLHNLDRHPNAVDFILDDKVVISGNSTGGGNIEITKINEFETSISGEYPTLIIFYKDKPGMISRVTQLILEKHINVATMNCTRNAKGETASMCICLDSPAEQGVVEKISELDDVYFVRNIDKMDS